MDIAKNMWWVYINGYRVVQTRSIGYKWVYYKTTHSRYKRISRAKWDKACISTLAEHQYKLDVINQAHDLGISMTKPSRKKYGWSFKTFEELEAEALANKQEVA
jgi:hypothetical protein